MTTASERRRSSCSRLRTHRAYIAFVLAMKHYVLPTVFALCFLLTIVMVVGRSLFAIESAFGCLCDPNATPAAFDTRSPYWPTGQQLEAGRRYRITVTPEGWKDGGLDVASPQGFETARLPWWAYPALLFRRHLFVEWYRPIARIGAYGNDETPLDLQPTSTSPTRYEAEIEARTSGRLYLYVNDGALPFSWLWAPFYANNSGRAEVGITPIDAAPAAVACGCDEPADRSACDDGNRR